MMNEQRQAYTEFKASFEKLAKALEKGHALDTAIKKAEMFKKLAEIEQAAKDLSDKFVPL